MVKKQTKIYKILAASVIIAKFWRCQFCGENHIFAFILIPYLERSDISLTML